MPDLPDYEPPKKKRSLRFVRKPGSSDFGGRASPSQLILATDATTPVRGPLRDPLYAQAELMLGMLAAPVKTPSVSDQPDAVRQLRSRADNFEEDEEDEGDYTDYDDDEFDDDIQPIGGLSALRNATALHTPEKFRAKTCLSLVAAAAGSPN
jgi:hypothetical protein